MPLDVVRRLIGPLRTPIVTSRYPAAPPVLQPATHGLPVVDPTRCDREDACVAACPTAAITVTDSAWAIDAGRCVFCSACVSACPTGAVTMGGPTVLVRGDRAALVILTRLEPRT